MRKSILAALLLVLLGSTAYCGVLNDMVISMQQNMTASTFANLKEPMSINYGGITSIVGYKQTSTSPYLISIDFGIITDAQKLAYGVGLGINLGEILKKSIKWDINDYLKNGRIGFFMAKYQWETKQVDMAGVYIGELIGK